jgi:hypothetical protein
MSALTEEGKEKLLFIKHKINIPLKDRFLYNGLFEETVTNDDPYTIVIRLRNKSLAAYVSPKDLIDRFSLELTRMGVQQGIDYTIEGK